MSTEFEIAETMDVTGLNCPLPVVKTRQAIDDLAEGAVLEVLATDPGSVSDLGEWADATDGVELLRQTEEDGDETVYRHYVRRTE